MPCVFTWLLSVRLHAVHHGVVLQGQALLHLEGQRSIHPRQPRYRRAVLDECMRVWPHPHQGWESWGRCATAQHTSGAPSTLRNCRLCGDCCTYCMGTACVLLHTHTTSGPTRAVDINSQNCNRCPNHFTNNRLLEWSSSMGVSVAIYFCHLQNSFSILWNPSPIVCLSLFPEAVQEAR